MSELRPLSHEAVDGALEKAERYRLLNEPFLAESICLDVLAVEPENQRALVTLLLARTDQFPTRLSTALREALEIVPRLEGEYARVYYEGIIWERRAETLYHRNVPGATHKAHDDLRRALELYRRAIELHPEGNEDAILRWNTCVRILERHPHLRDAPEDAFQPLLE
jgi:tetratricopeptide (TPR) repeat protein